MFLTYTILILTLIAIILLAVVNNIVKIRGNVETIESSIKVYTSNKSVIICRDVHCVMRVVEKLVSKSICSKKNITVEGECTLLKASTTYIVCCNTICKVIRPQCG